METIYLAKWGSRFWAWLIDILLVSVLSDLIVESSGFFGILASPAWKVLELAEY